MHVHLFSTMADEFNGETHWADEHFKSGTLSIVNCLLTFSTRRMCINTTERTQNIVAICIATKNPLIVRTIWQSWTIFSHCFVRSVRSSCHTIRRVWTRERNNNNNNNNGNASILSRLMHCDRRAQERSLNIFFFFFLFWTSVKGQLCVFWFRSLSPFHSLFFSFLPLSLPLMSKHKCQIGEEWPDDEWWCIWDVRVRCACICRTCVKGATALSSALFFCKCLRLHG